MTHCQVLSPELIGKLTQLGVLANIQGSFVPTESASKSAEAFRKEESLEFFQALNLYTISEKLNYVVVKEVWLNGVRHVIDFPEKQSAASFPCINH